MSKKFLILIAIILVILAGITFNVFYVFHFYGSILLNNIIWSIITFVFVITLLKLNKKSVEEIVEKVNKMANGDLTKKITSDKDSIYIDLCSNINTLLLNVRQLINESTTMTDKVINHCESLSKNAELAEAAANCSFSAISAVSTEMSEQLEGTQQAENLVYEIIDEYKEVIQTGIDIEALANSMMTTVNKSTKIYEELSSRLNESASSNLHLSSKVKNLNNKAQTIQSIADKVTEISRSTSLLSFNAAIEAAKASEVGAGFAVVAEEIRKLSAISSIQAREIQSIIDEIRIEVADISSQMDNEVDTINRNIDFSNITKENLDNIFTESKNVLHSIEGINRIIDTQNVKISVIKGTIVRTAKISANTTSATQEVTASSENQLTAVTNVFNSISKLTDMNKSLKDNIASFAQNYIITNEIQKYIDDGLETLRRLASQPSLSTMDYQICTKILNDNINRYPYFELIGLVDKFGLRKAITLDYKEDEVYADFSHRPYFKAAVKGSEYKSKPYISVDTNSYCIAIAVPVNDSFGEIAEVLMADLILG